jgi:hypothetical protein
MAIINSFFSWIMKKRIHQIELFIKYPIDVQEELLRKLISTAKNTEIGKFFDYNSIKNVEEFRNRIPVQNYETHKPYIKRLMLGEQNLLWPTEVKWFAKSSGTTSDKSKFIPVTAESMEECHFKGGKDLLSIYFNNHPESNLFSGRFLTLGGSHQINSFSNESFYGDLSAIIMQNLPFWMELFRTPDLSVALMDEWEDKIRKIADITIREDVTSISGVPSWMLVLMKYILEITGKENLLQIWPNLELFVHGAVSFTPYEMQFKKLIPKSGMNYVETYNASEGFFGIQDRSQTDDMLLMLDYGIYYEFIEDHHLGFDVNKAISLSDVELDKNYAMLITTNGGLWRYQIGDTVTFTSLNPHRIKITGRTAHFINAFGEELIVDNAEKAIASACQKTNAVLRDYTAAPIYFSEAESGGHEWLIEFENQPSSLDEFIYYLDQKLKELNSDYEAKRYHDKVLSLPVVRHVPDGTFYNWLKSKDKLGGQHKVPRLSNNRKIVEELIQQLHQ